MVNRLLKKRKGREVLTADAWLDYRRFPSAAVGVSPHIDFLYNSNDFFGDALFGVGRRKMDWTALHAFLKGKGLTVKKRYFGQEDPEAGRHWGAYYEVYQKGRRLKREELLRILNKSRLPKDDFGSPILTRKAAKKKK